MKVTEYNIRIKIPVCLEKLPVWFVLLYRRLRFGYPFRRIPLTQGKYATVDPEDYERLNKHKWHVNAFQRTFYAVRSLGGQMNRRVIKMHRQIMKAPDWLFVDHINRNGLDNRKTNLRLATRAQNSWNRGKANTRRFTSRYKGVSWCKRRKKWRTLISFNGRQKSLGYFNNEVEAACAYDNAARIYHGEFAVLNFPH